MRRLLPFFLLIIASAQSISIEDLVKEYKDKEYKKVCNNGFKLFDSFRKNENLVNMYAFSCLKSDYLGRVGYAMLFLGKTPQSRTNRTYFSTIIAQKNILFSILMDEKRLQGLRFPKMDYVISKVFDLFFQKKYKKLGPTYFFKDQDKNYEMWLDKKNRRLVIKEIDHNLTTIHRYK